MTCKNHSAATQQNLIVYGTVAFSLEATPKGCGHHYTFAARPLERVGEMCFVGRRAEGDQRMRCNLCFGHDREALKTKAIQMEVFENLRPVNWFRARKQCGGLAALPQCQNHGRLSDLPCHGKPPQKTT